jgi:hypothetical protein
MNSVTETWCITRDNKRPRTPETLEKSAKQKRTDKDWLGFPIAPNKYDVLRIENESDMACASNESDPLPVAEAPVPKPPPIFVHDIVKIKGLTQQLELTARNGYVLKILHNNQVKIQPKAPEFYTAIIKFLADSKAAFHTFQMKQDRSYRVVLKNMHPSADVEDIKAELMSKNHIVRNIHNIRDRVTKKPLPMFFVELAPNANNREIYDIEFILQCRIRFEPPHQKREVVQCLNCQMYGHTKRFCNHNPRCVKCAGDHSTSDCSRKVRSEDVKCVLCKGDHPANYKGCTVYKDIQKFKFPAQRPRQLPLNPRESASAHIPAESEPGLSNRVQKDISYAQATIGRRAIPQPASQDIPVLQQSPTQQVQQSSDMAELKQMMKSLMEQMGTILNLLTVFVTKMK